ncbi:hypothetical protein L207DRAFT_631269 [Hyaloscypha variabilis F]|uniref:DUF4148 domain-containing protein n=1 Tax=Hyaloscypha variabilis (strain UAMH 11265 / GT02V1 / F) TaxID=1149755 RepID=A0A2J6RX82_HYAVF|nr:hypothetical protein L207DRAFT_631269 [Hyaloscypha variabilis F]
MLFKSFLVGAFLLLFSLHATASPIPEAAFESYVSVKGSKYNDQASRDVQKIKRLGDEHLIERNAEPSVPRDANSINLYAQKRTDDWNTPGGHTDVI